MSMFLNIFTDMNTPRHTAKYCLKENIFSIFKIIPERAHNSTELFKRIHIRRVNNNI